MSYHEHRISNDGRTYQSWELRLLWFIDMSIAPLIAQKRAQNFAVAEIKQLLSLLPTYECKVDIPDTTETCVAAAREVI